MLTRRTVLRTLPAIAVLTKTMYIYAASPAKTTRVLIGTGTGRQSASKGIYVADYNVATGEIGELTLAVTTGNPTWISLSPRAPRIYAIGEGRPARVTAFDIKIEDKAFTLEHVNDQSCVDAGPAHVAINIDGASAFVSNYGGGGLASYRIDPATGALSEPVSHLKITPVDDAPEHAHPHIHESTPSPDGKFLLVNDLGSDRIWIYAIDLATATLTHAAQPFWQARNKSGPRHMAFHPNKRWVYSVNELDSTLDTLLYDAKTGSLTTHSPAISTLNPDFPKDTAFASEVVASSDGRFLYIGNRRNETVAMMTINPKTGAPTLAQVIAHGGVTARHITLDPTEKFLLVACQDSGAVVVMGRDAKSGKLTGPLHSYNLASPQCIIFTT